MVSPILWTFLIIFFGLAAGVLLFYPTATVPYSKQDWILITDFENLTGDQVFDKSLITAFSVSIAQSSYISVFPRRRITETMKRMKKEDVNIINEETGQEIALREGINIIIVPSISKISNNYTLTAVIQNPLTGEAYDSEIVHARGKDNVLNALDDLTKKIRKDLGESFFAIAKQSKTVADVTTSSLQALKQYSLGSEKLGNSNFKAAKLFYESALQIDSTFTSAKASLGMLNYEKFDQEKGKALLSDAVENGIDKLTDQEKYGILSFYASAVENDLEKAIEFTKMRLALYPNDEAGLNNLGWYSFQMGHYKKAINAYKKAIRINPNLMLPYDGLSWIYLYYLGEVDSGIVWCEKQLSYNNSSAWAYNNLGWAYLGIDSLNLALNAFERSLEINPRFIFVLDRIAHTYRLQGRYQEAIDPLKTVLEINPNEFSANYDLGVIYQLLGNTEAARQNFTKFRETAEKWLQEDPNDAENFLALATVLTRMGQKERGLALGLKAMTLDSSRYFEYAGLLSLQGKNNEALDQLEIAVKNGYTNYIWIKIHPDLQALYDEPRFVDLINKGLKK